MACIIDNGLQLGCSSIGGISNVYIGTYESGLVYTLDVDNNITGLTSPATGVYEFAQDVEYAGLTQNAEVSRENGTVFIKSSLSVKFIEMTAELRNTFLALVKAPIYAVVKANTGQHYLLGYSSAGRAVEGSAGLGVAQGDMNGATLKFEWSDANGIFLLDDGVLGGADIPVL